MESLAVSLALLVKTKAALALQSFHDAIEVLKRRILDHDLALPFVVTNCDTHSECALHLFFGGADVGILSTLGFCFAWCLRVLWSEHAVHELLRLADGERCG